MKTLQNKNVFGKMFTEKDSKVIVTALGVRLQIPHHMQDGEHKKPRGCVKKAGSSIKTFSQASSRRLRKALIDWEPLPDHKQVALCVTVPVGSGVLDDGGREKVWKTFTNRNPVCAAGFWRLEQTEKGQPHWHLVLSVPDNAVAALAVEVAIRRKWFKAIDSLGVSTQTLKSGGTCTCVRSQMYGAEKKAVEFHPIEEVGGALRYLMDHASKKKRGQIAKSGRHWGFFNKKEWDLHYRPAAGDSHFATPGQRVALHRLLRKWARPIIWDYKCKRVIDGHKRSAPFGCRHGWESKRGLVGGESIWFGVPDYLVKWALDHPAPLRSDPATWDRIQRDKSLVGPSDGVLCGCHNISED